MSAPRRDSPSDSNHAAVWRPGKLWSLWDMLKVNAAAFYYCVTWFRSIETTVVHMQRENPKIWDDPMREDPGSESAGLADDIAKEARSLKEEVHKLGLPMTEMSVDRLIEAVEEPNCSLSIVSRQMEQIDLRLRDELTLTSLFVLPATQAGYFEPKTSLFGADVETKFPTAVYEIDEGAKCFGLSRHTACVFHLMRTMEIGIRAAARCLTIPDPIKPAERNWGAILRAIRAELDRRKAAGARPWNAPSDKQLFEEVYTSLDAVRNTWRNATMHVENKYSEDEANHIFTAVRAFMRKIASRFDEQGQPAA
jgi:hypothetical protein